MERMEEYRSLLEELDREPERLSGAVCRAKKRARRARVRRYAGTAAAGLVSLAACFVLLVNFCAPVALACGKVPVLRELARAVIFSQSLSAAVANEHVQFIGQERMMNGYTIRLEYVIADQKQANVFFTVEGEPPEGEYFSAWVDVTTEDAPPHSIIGGLAHPGELEYVCVNFEEGTTPEHLDLTVTVGDTAGGMEEPASCDFSLDLDPYRLSLGRTVEVNQDFHLDGNAFTLTTVELYPTHMRLNIAQDADNADWLKGLELTVTGDGRDVDRLDNKGLSSTGGGKEGILSIYTASSWYYDCKELTLTITGAAWLDKERTETVVDLKNGTATGLPEGVAFMGISAEGEYHDETAGMVLKFTVENGPYSFPFEWEFRDEAGTVYENTHMSATAGVTKSAAGVRYGIGDFREDTVILGNLYSHTVTMDEPLVLTVPVGSR